MIFKTRDIKRHLSTVHDFGIKNLIVSGCSFTYNGLDDTAVTWPYFLRDLGGFEQVLDCSLPGAGNSHISNSLIWGLEMDQPDPADSLVIVMWSGHDRDDYIFPKENVNNYSTPFYYSKNVMSSIKNAGDLLPESNRNGIANELMKLSMAKSNESRAIENYLHIAKTYEYLNSLNYKFLFLNFINLKESVRGEVGGSDSFDIRKHLPKSAQQKLNLMITEINDPYHFSVRYNLIDADNFHPSYYGHIRWTKKILIPHLQSVFD